MATKQLYKKLEQDTGKENLLKPQETIWEKPIQGDARRTECKL